MGKTSITFAAKNSLFFFTALAFGVCSVCTQILGYINGDSAWLVSVAARVASGEVLNVDVVETNPPLAVYLNFPVIWVSNLGISLPFAFVAYVTLLSIISLSLSFRQIDDLCVKLSLVFGALFLAAVNFGQREYLMILLILPWFSALIKNKDQGILISILAGIGFAIKPYGVIIFAGLAIADALYNKSLKRIFRPIHLIPALVISNYVIYLILLERNYISNVLPLLLKYYDGYNQSWVNVLKSVLNVLIISQAGFVFIFCFLKKHLNKEIYFTAFASLLAILCVVIQRKLFTSHFYPAYFFGFLTNVFIIKTLAQDSKLFSKMLVSFCAVIIVGYIAIASLINYRHATHYFAKDMDEALELLLPDGSLKEPVVYSLSANLGPLYPLMLYVDGKYKSKYVHLFMLPGLYKNGHVEAGEMVVHLPEEQGVDEREMVNTVISEIKNLNPALIMVDESDYHLISLGYFKFNFVKYFSQEQEFRDLWKDYYLMKKIGNTSYYKRKD